MDCRHEKIICLSHEAVGNVDNERTGDRIRLNPVAGLAENFETARRVLSNNGEAFDVRVRADTVLFVYRVLLLWVVEDAHSRLWPLDIFVEVIFRQVESECEDAG